MKTTSRGHSTISLLKNQTLRKKARSAQEDSFDQAEGVLYGVGIAD